jgi:hypothetical protein
LKGIPKATEGSSKNISDEFFGTNDKKKTYMRDTTKPVGDACRDDGTLKDANEMDWPDSPTALEAPQNDFREDNASDIYCDEPGPQDEPNQNDLPSITKVN